MLEGVFFVFEWKGVVLNFENYYVYDYYDGNELFSEFWEFKEIFSLDSLLFGFCFDMGYGNMMKNFEVLIWELVLWFRYIHMVDNQGMDDDYDMFCKGIVEWDCVFFFF